MNATREQAYIATGQIRDLVFSAIEQLQYGGASDTNGYGILYSPTSTRRCLVKAISKLESALKLVGSATCAGEDQIA